MGAPGRKQTFLYVVHWEEQSVLKVGIASHMGRVRKHTKTGARVLVIAKMGDGERGRERALRAEAAALAVMRIWYFHAFGDATESLPLLEGGRGYTECFEVRPGRMLEAAVTWILAEAGRG